MNYGVIKSNVPSLSNVSVINQMFVASGVVVTQCGVIYIMELMPINLRLVKCCVVMEGYLGQNYRFAAAFLVPLAVLLTKEKQWRR